MLEIYNFLFGMELLWYDGINKLKIVSWKLV